MPTLSPNEGDKDGAPQVKIPAERLGHPPPDISAARQISGLAQVAVRSERREACTPEPAPAVVS